MKNASIRLLLFVLSVLLPPLSVLVSLPQDTPHKVVVRPHDSISFLAMRYYGFFNDSLFAVLKRANSHLKDLNHLEAGAQLRFPPRLAPKPPLEMLRASAASAVVTYCEGEVQYRRVKSGGAFSVARANLFLYPGDELRTGKGGRAELVLDYGSVLRLDAASHLRIVALVRGDSSSAGKTGYRATFELMVGSLWTRITKIFDRTPQIETQFPTAIAGVQGTIYRAEVAPDSATNVRVYEGAVELKSKPSRAQRTGPPTPIGPPRQVPGPTEVSLETWVKLVRAYQEIRIAKDGRPGEPAPFADQGAGLQWVRWNQARDRELDAER